MADCRLIALLEQQPDFLAWADYAIAAQLRRTCRAGLTKPIKPSRPLSCRSKPMRRWDKDCMP